MAEVNPQLNPQPLPPGFAIRVSAPASVLYDLETFQKAQAGVLKHAGCPGAPLACKCSGRHSPISRSTRQVRSVQLRLAGWPRAER